jgi:hypothetical protein
MILQRFVDHFAVRRAAGEPVHRKPELSPESPRRRRLPNAGLGSGPTIPAVCDFNSRMTVNFQHTFLWVRKLLVLDDMVGTGAHEGADRQAFST